MPSYDTVLLTDHPWPEVDLERDCFAAAGYQLAVGPAMAAPAAEIEALVARHDPCAIMTCWAQVSARAIALPARLRVIARLGVGLDNIDIPAATVRAAWVTNVPDYCVEEVSDHTVALLLAHARGIARFDRQTKSGQWRPDTAAGLQRVRDLCIGIAGFGHTGKLTARKLRQGWGCRVLVYTPGLVKRHQSGAVLENGEEVATLEALQQQADVIALHLPLTPATHHMINHEFLTRCLRRPLLINVSRGGLIDSHALLKALDAGLISAAALDVIEHEPGPPPEVLRHPRVIATPHAAYASTASLLELRQRACDEVLRVLRGEMPKHPCNQP